VTGADNRFRGRREPESQGGAFGRGGFHPSKV
jgi:hypothetical protein